eukprot:gene18637-25152_t
METAYININISHQFLNICNQEAKESWTASLVAANDGNDVQLSLDILAALRDPLTKVMEERWMWGRGLGAQMTTLENLGRGRNRGRGTGRGSGSNSSRSRGRGKVVQELQPLRYYSSRVPISLVWLIVSLLFLVAAYLITDNAFKAKKSGGTQSKKPKVEKEKAEARERPRPPSSAPSTSDQESATASPPSARKASSAKPSPPKPTAGASLTGNTVDSRMAINSGRVQEAMELMAPIIEEDPYNLGARISRGTARALLVDLQGAVEDFSVAIEVEPRYADSWKRRGQALNALGENDGALRDLQKAIDLLPNFGGDYQSSMADCHIELGTDYQSSMADCHIELGTVYHKKDYWNACEQDYQSSMADCHIELGTVYHKKKDYWNACEQLEQALKLEPNNPKAWNVYGMCTTLQGNINDGIKGYQRATEILPSHKEAWLNMGMALKESARTQEAEEAFANTFALDSPDAPSLNAMFTLSQMRQQLGNQTGAIEILDHALSFGKPEFRVQLLYMRAVCHHALGNTKEAVKDYTACLAVSLGSASEDEVSYQALCFYQREIVLYVFHSLDRNVDEFSMDAELQPLFKESWCKRSIPSPELLAQYTYQAPVPATPPPTPPAPDAAMLKTLTTWATYFGNLLQNKHQGFLSNRLYQRAAGFAGIELAQTTGFLYNRRFQRAAGLAGIELARTGFLSNRRYQRAAGFAGIELAQTIVSLLKHKRNGIPMRVNSEGSTLHGGAPGQHEFGWRDAMDIVVKWRQITEPNDQVIWVDMLTRREYEQGFGSHTPLFDGQTKTVRYYMNFPKALELQKKTKTVCYYMNFPKAVEQQKTKTVGYYMNFPNALEQQKKVLLETGHATSFEASSSSKDPSQHVVSCDTAEQREALKNVTTAKDMYMVLKEDSWVMLPIHSYYRPGHMMEGTRFTLSKMWYTTFSPPPFGAGETLTSYLAKHFRLRYQVDWEAILSQHPETFAESGRNSG